MRKILFVELLGGIGDVLIALPAMAALGRSYPQAELVVLTLPPGGELLENQPGISQVFYAEQDNPSKAVELLLARHSFDLIVSDTNHNNIDAVIQNSGAPRVVTNLWRKPPADQRVGDRFLQILLAEGLIKSTTSSSHGGLCLTLAEQQRAQEVLGFLPRPLIFLVPDAGMEIKRWSTENFIALGQALQQRYRASVVIPVGSNLEQATDIASAIGNTQIWPRGKLRDLAAAIASADLVIAADTGPARIAAALNVPTVTLFGPSWHGRYGQPPPHVNLQGYPECPERVVSNFTEQRCWYEGVCPLDKKWRTCLEAISVADLLAAVRLFLEEM